MTYLSEDARSALLLTSWFTRQGARPLSRTEYNAVEKLVKSGFGWESILSGQTEQVPVDPERIISLASRGFALAESVDRWSSAGIWIAGRKDPQYPAFLKQLKENAPPVVFGAGIMPTGDKLTVVGSRDAPPDAMEATELIGRNCARENIVVVSGGARGIDQASTSSCLQEGGRVVEILAHDLLSTVISGNARWSIEQGNACFISEVPPEARFQTALVMERNRLLIAAGGAMAVMDVQKKRGGTRQGVLDAIRLGLNTVFIYGGNGSNDFFRKGCLPLTREQINHPRALLEFKETSRTSDDQTAPPDLYSAFVQWLLLVCQKPRSLDELRQRNPDLNFEQWNLWLGRALDEGKLTMEGNFLRSSEQQQTLF
jgi:predicted Rossmann fold nucleotide-binding protein DprA/Smf involved in DNA uptake